MTNVFCSACGNACVPTAEICPKCGSPIRDTAPVGNSRKYFDANALGTGFWDVLKRKYFTLKGRARRREYWWFTLIQALVACLILFVLTPVCMQVIPNPDGSAITGVGMLFVIIWLIGVISVLALTIPSICLQVRRLHDIGCSGWVWLINLVPYVGGLILLVLMCFDSQRGDNEYGPNPKGVD